MKSTILLTPPNTTISVKTATPTPITIGGTPNELLKAALIVLP